MTRPKKKEAETIDPPPYYGVCDLCQNYATGELYIARTGERAGKWCAEHFELMKRVTCPKEVDVRLSLPSVGPPRPWLPAERYGIYCQGFRDGAGTGRWDEGLSGLSMYHRGYEDGKKARRDAFDSYSKEVGYSPSILRVQDDG
jgi:hypothetical protein